MNSGSVLAGLKNEGLVALTKGRGAQSMLTMPLCHATKHLPLMLALHEPPPKSEAMSPCQSGTAPVSGLLLAHTQSHLAQVTLSSFWDLVGAEWEHGMWARCGPSHAPSHGWKAELTWPENFL